MPIYLFSLHMPFCSMLNGSVLPFFLPLFFNAPSSPFLSSNRVYICVFTDSPSLPPPLCLLVAPGPCHDPGWEEACHTRYPFRVVVEPVGDRHPAGRKWEKCDGEADDFGGGDGLGPIWEYDGLDGSVR